MTFSISPPFKSLIAVLLLAFTSIGLHAQSLPNILLITADDLGLQLGCYGDKEARTPHLDKLSQASVQFQNGYVTHASCSPSRSSMFTGMFPHENGQIGLSHLGYEMHPGMPILPNLLKAKDYRTGVIGKVHVEPFSEFIWDDYIGKKVNMRDIKEIRDSCQSFFKKEKGRPFFFMANYSDPHRHFPAQVNGVPKVPFKASDVKPFSFLQISDLEVREEIAKYYSCVTRVDEGVGLLLEALEKEGLSDNTLVIFLGDHGPPFTRSKTTCYESAMRVPIFVRFPDKSFAGKVMDDLVSSIDILPTVLESAGIPCPPEVTGKSLLPLIRGEEKNWRKTLATEYTSHHGPGGYYPRRAIRDERFKLIHNLNHHKRNPHLSVDRCKAWAASQQRKYRGTIVDKIMTIYQNPPEFELYDLAHDPDELHELSEIPEYQNAFKDMKTKLLKWRQETNDPLLDPAKLRELNEFHKNFKHSKRNLH
ncbi:MAG: sulfatase [Planctomycetes bacterium]|nr:sulfatase [Planctomycetota bacterium]